MYKKTRTQLLTSIAILVFFLVPAHAADQGKDIVSVLSYLLLHIVPEPLMQADAGDDDIVSKDSHVILDGSGSTHVRNSTLSYSWQLLIKPAGSQATLSGTTSVYPSFEADVAGEFTAELVVSDGIGESSPDTVIITVTERPIAKAGDDDTVAKDAHVILDGSGSTQADNAALNYSWQLLTRPAGSQATLNGATSVDPSFEADVAGEFTAELVVSDGIGESSPDTVIITVTERPIAKAGDDRKDLVDSTITLDGTDSSDSGTGQLAWSWQFLSTPSGSGAVLDDETSSTPAFIANIPGPYVLELRVNNGLAESAPDIVVVNVLEKNYVNAFEMIFKAISPGTFQRGDYSVTLTKLSFMQITEVTQKQWKLVLDEAENKGISIGGLSKTPSYNTGCQSCPVEQVSWVDAKDFIGILNQLGQGSYRLPTEAEWEYSARAGSTTAYANGDTESDLEAIGWFYDNTPIPRNAQVVAQKEPNGWGLYDMHGNVWEWVEDGYQDYPEEDVTDPPPAPSSGGIRVYRGGSFINISENCTSAFRDYDSRIGSQRDYGFRLYRSL